jgi:hypothetical protein
MRFVATPETAKASLAHLLIEDVGQAPRKRYLGWASSSGG